MLTENEYYSILVNIHSKLVEILCATIWKYPPQAKMNEIFYVLCILAKLQQVIY